MVSTDNEDAIKSPVHSSDIKNNNNLSNSENLDTVLEELSERQSFDNQSLENNSAREKLATVAPPQYIEPVVPVEEKPLKIKIKTGYIRSYQESLEKSAKKSVEAPLSVSLEQEEEEEEKVPARVTRRRNKTEKQEPVVASAEEKSEEKDFDSQSSILGSVRSNSAASSTSVPNSTYLPDCRVIHSRGSSCVTSDLENTSQQSSLAAAPPSDPNCALASDNTSTDNVASIVVATRRKRSEIMQPELVAPVVPPVPEKSFEKPVSTRGRRAGIRRGKNLPTEEEELKKTPTEQAKVPEPEVVPETVIEEPKVEEEEEAKESPKKRGRRAAVVAKKKMKAVIEEPETPPKRTSGRVTRNKAAQETQETILEPVVSPPVVTKPATQSTTRSYGRKRKNPQPVEEEFDDADKQDASEDQMSTTVNLSQATATEESSSQYKSDTTSNPVSDSTTISSSQNYSVDIKNNFQQPEYKHKKLLKRSWMEDRMNVFNTKNSLHQVQQEQQLEIPAVPVAMEMEEQQQPVKLVISKKKGSIFKSRALVKDEDNSKKRHVYKHKWDNDNSENPEMDDNMEFNEKEPDLPLKKSQANPSTHNTNNSYFEDFDNGESSGLTRIVKNPGNDGDVFSNFDDQEDVSSLRCDKKVKKFYTVVRNVKKAHQIQEIGEFQEMDDDVEYILSALQPDNQMATRCLSALQLASKCMIPSFRMHVRAHGIVTKFFKALSDATEDPGLGLCTAMVMFVLSMDNLNMDLDHDSLKLMLSLLDCDSQAVSRGSAAYRQLEEKKIKIRELCEDIQSQGKVIHFNLDNISVGLLAMETLLSLTSKRAGEWFKEELRNLGGIEHIIKTVCECCGTIGDYVAVWDEPMKEKLNKISRCNRVLENVTQLNEENLKYVLEYKDHLFIKTLYRTFKLLDRELIAHPTDDTTPKDDPAVAIREALVPILKILINLTHPFSENGEDFLFNILGFFFH